jgi:hypothetical protein
MRAPISKSKANSNRARSGPGAKVTPRSKSTGKSNPKAAVKYKGSHPPVAGKRAPGYKGEGPYNISGPGSRIPKKPKEKRKPAPMPTPSSTRKPAPKPTRIGEPGTFGEGMLLLSGKSKSKGKK